MEIIINASGGPAMRNGPKKLRGRVGGEDEAAALPLLM